MTLRANLSKILSRLQKVTWSLFVGCFLLVLALWAGTIAVKPAVAKPIVFAPEAVVPTANVDLDDVEIDHALRLLAELYDVSIVSGALPESRVSVRLRDVGFEDAIQAVALAAEVSVEKRGAVYLISKAASGSAHKVLFDTSAMPRQDLSWLPATDVQARFLRQGTLMLEGEEAAVEAATQALENVQQKAVVDRVFPLGVAEGEETLAAISPLLRPGVEFVSYDETSHAITVSALPLTLERLSKLLATLTKSPSQFEIEVQVVEVSRNALKRMGAQGSFRLDIRGGLFPTTFPLEGLDDAARYFPSPNDLGDLQDIGTGTGQDPSGSLGDSSFRFGQIDARGLGMLIEFLEQSGEARIMATPKVTALDNRWAKISMVTTLRIPTFTQNQAFATTTVSGIEEVDVGTVLEVRPRKGDRREILLTVTPEVSELETSVELFTQGGLTQGLPVVTRRRTETEVILETGETLVIGGLVRERETDTTGKTPGLGNLPLIGRAFQHKGKVSNSSELLVFVTPRELPAPEIRRAKTRIDEVWIPNELARKVQAAREALAAPTASRRQLGIRQLERLDPELLTHDLDLARDLILLGEDPDLKTRVEAALFLLRRRPTLALGELARFTRGRTVALEALDAPLAPHLRLALAELLARSEDGIERLAHRLDKALKRKDPQVAARLLEALSAVDPLRAGRVVSGDLATTLPSIHRLDALGAEPGQEAWATAQAVGSSSREVRAYAAAALERTLKTDLSVQEEALSWSGVPLEIDLRGEAQEVGRVRKALDLLANRAPDLHQMVAFALAKVETGTERLAVDPQHRAAQVPRGLAPERLAHQLVRLATLVFESRVRGYPANSERSLARAVREEIAALERLTGAPCSEEQVEATVLQVLSGHEEE